MSPRLAYRTPGSPAPSSPDGSSSSHALLLLGALAALTATSPAQSVAPYVLATHDFAPHEGLGRQIIEDLDGDGVVDILDAGYSWSQTGVLVRRGVGDGSFEPAVITLSPSGVYSIACDDADADGHRDVVALGGSMSGYQVEFFEGLGNGDLAPPLSSAVAISPQLSATDPLLLADLDADGLPELGTHAASWLAMKGTTFVIKNLGAGSFGTTLELVPSGGASALGLRFGDTDGDGDLDALVLRDDTHAALEVFANDGLGALSAQPPTVDLNMLPVYFHVTDLDGDGLADAVVHSGPARQVVRNMGQGQFESVSFEMLPVSPAPLIVDVNGDSLPDLISTGSDIDSYYQTWLHVSLGTGPFTFSPPVIYGAGADVNLVGVRDMDGDSLLDVVLSADAYGVSSLYIVMRGLGIGAFDAPQRIGVGLPTWGMTGADAEGDGDLDLITVNYLADMMLINNDAGVFAPPASLGIALGAGEIISGDLNGDGLDDLVVEHLDGAISFVPLINVSQGAAVAFVAAAPTASAIPVFRILVSDMDGDGDLDLMPVSPANAIAAYANQGDASFQPLQTFALGNLLLDAAIADIDDDGLPDALFTVTKTGPFSILRFDGLGAGAFAPGADIPVAVKPDQLATADFDQDGLVDLAVGGKVADVIKVLHNQGAGSFAELDEEPVFYEPDRILVLDADHDGFPDILSGSYVYPQLSLSRSVGDGTIELVGHIQATQSTIEHAITGDFDGDGDPEVALRPTNGYDEIWVYDNISPAFANLGFGFAAPFATPELTATGVPVPDQKVSLTATGVPSPALGFLIVGLTTSHQPFKGGTLVPAPDAALPTRPDAPLCGRWPPLASGTALYFQAWFEVGGEFAATNALAGVTP